MLIKKCFFRLYFCCRLSNHLISKMLGRLSGMAIRSYSTDLKFRPFFDRVLIERFLPEQKTKGGIMIPEKAQGKVLEGTVVAVGPGFRNDDGKTIPMQLNVGDRVLLPEYGGSKLAFEDKEYHIFRESDIIGKFD